jgi:peptidoglycan/LPS O-acetylase OafA/YrhL
VEEHFYLIWPAVVYLLPRRGLLVACVGCFIGALVLRTVLVAWVYDDLWTVYLLTPCRMDGLALGGALALLVRDRSGLAWATRNAARVFLGSALLLVVGFAWQNTPHQGTPFTETVGHTLIVTLSGALLILVLTRPRSSWLGAVAASGPMRFLGKYSFGLYVLHRPIIFPLKMLIPYEMLSLKFGSAIAGVLVFQLIALILSVLCAMASWYLLESQFLKLKKYFASDRPPPPTA